jgi:hypothetical protein
MNINNNNKKEKTKPSPSVASFPQLKEDLPLKNCPVREASTGRS